MNTTLEDALTRCAELRAKLQAAEHDRTEMAEALRDIIRSAAIDADEGDLALAALSEIRGTARSLLARLEGGEK